jgi:hypothetical protein
VTDRAPRSGTDGLKVPRALRPDVEQIVALTDGLCAEHLDAEAERRSRGLIGDLATGT